MKKDPFLTVILVVIALLILASLAVFFLRQDNAVYLPEDSPENIVHNYLLAIKKGEYSRAYGYLADEKYKPNYEEFEDNFVFYENTAGYQIGETIISEKTAHVEITIMEGSGNFMFDRYDYVEKAQLVKEKGYWRITEMPYTYWNWEWYKEE